MAKPKFLRRNRKLFMYTVITAVLIVGVFIYEKSRSNNKEISVNTPSSASITDQKSILEQEKEEADAHKQALIEQSQNENSSTNNNSSKKQVSVVITNASANRIAAYVSGVFENGGTCTATLTQGSQKITKKSAGFENATTTNCTPINLSRSDFLSSGTWDLVISYSSATAEGQSESKTVDVQ